MWASMKSAAKLALGKGVAGKCVWKESMGTLWQFKNINNIDKKPIDMEKEFNGNSVFLVTNVACKCGLTKKSYDEMESLAKEFNSKGLKIICFPSNQFAGQEPWPNEAVKAFVEEGWPNMDAYIMDKVNVNGENAHPIYKWLKKSFENNDDIAWNFATRFIVSADGVPLHRFDVNQSWADVKDAIQTQIQLKSKSNESEKEQKIDDKVKDEEKKDEKD